MNQVSFYFDGYYDELDLEAYVEKYPRSYQEFLADKHSLESINDIEHFDTFDERVEFAERTPNKYADFMANRYEYSEGEY